MGSRDEHPPVQESTVIQMLAKELEADRTLWQGLIGQLPDDHPMHALLGLRLASIEAVLRDATDHLEASDER